MSLHFLVPGDINTLTGGYVYNKIIIEGLRKIGHSVILHQFSGDFPFPSEENLKKCGLIFSKIPAREPVFIDSLAFGPMHNILTQYIGKNPVIAIMHLPMSKNPNFSLAEQNSFSLQEEKAMKYATRIVAVSSFTKQLILEYGTNPSKINVIPPGIFELPRKQDYPEYPKKLLCVGSYLPGKGQLLMVQALSKLKYLTWTLNMYGIQDFDPEYVQTIRQKINTEGLTDRIILNPQVSGDELTSRYLNSDLFILPSYFENFSMALNDSLNYGIPVITTNAGGIPLSVPHNMGVFVSSGNENELEQAIKNVLTDNILYKNLCSATAQYYKTANSWETSVNAFHSLILNLGPESEMNK